MINNGWLFLKLRGDGSSYLPRQTLFATGLDKVRSLLGEGREVLVGFVHKRPPKLLQFLPFFHDWLRGTIRMPSSLFMPQSQKSKGYHGHGQPQANSADRFKVMERLKAPKDEAPLCLGEVHVARRAPIWLMGSIGFVTANH